MLFCGLGKGEELLVFRTKRQKFYTERIVSVKRFSCCIILRLLTFRMRSSLLVECAYSIQNYELFITASFENFSQTPGAFESVCSGTYSDAEYFGVLRKIAGAMLLMSTPLVRDEYIYPGEILRYTPHVTEGERRVYHPICTAIDDQIREHFHLETHEDEYFSFMMKMSLLDIAIEAAWKDGLGWLEKASFDPGEWLRRKNKQLLDELATFDVRGSVCHLAKKWAGLLYDEVLKTSSLQKIEVIVRWVMCGMYVDLKRKGLYIVLRSRTRNFQ